MREEEDEVWEEKEEEVEVEVEEWEEEKEEEVVDVKLMWGMLRRPAHLTPQFLLRSFFIASDTHRLACAK